MSGLSLFSETNFTQTEFTQWVNAALKNHDSLLELSCSPLAASPLIAPALVLDEVNPTADDRGRALRIVLRWAVNRLAPSAPHYPVGTPRPFDDPTWQNPLWWRYNILRHRYIEPFHPDELDECGSIDKLLELTGIPGADRLYDERNRAIREISLLLQEQTHSRQADSELRRMAIGSYLQQTPYPARDLMNVATTFRWAFPRSLLIEMATDELLAGLHEALDYLVAHRLLRVGDADTNLLCPPALQLYLHSRQPQARLTGRHVRAAKFYGSQCQPTRVAWHLQMAGQPVQAADVLLAAADALIADGQLDELREALDGLVETQILPDRWRAAQLVLGDLAQRTGHREQALSAFRRALKITAEPPQQARIFRRLGKLYEDDNQIRALGYYQHAAEQMAPNDPEWLDLLKDRAWLRIIRCEWAEAEGDLVRALDIAEKLAMENASPSLQCQRADIFSALASLHRQQAHYEQAIAYAQQTLSLREELGDLQRVADACANLGLIYDLMGEHDQAILAQEEALNTFRKISDREGIANAYLNIGAALYCRGRFLEAIDSYRESLAIFQAMRLPRGEAQAHQNLAEAFAALEQADKARWHWQVGYALSLEGGLDDQKEEFRSLRDRTPVLKDLSVVPGSASNSDDDNASETASSVSPTGQAALELARQAGCVTAKALMERGDVSKPTATRCLADLVKRGLLVRVGKGRASCYVLPPTHSH